VKNKKTLSIAVLGLAILAATVVSATADIYIKTKRHTDPFTVMGQAQPEKNEINITWLGKDVARFDMGDQTSTIVFPNKGKMIFLNHQDLAYSEMPLNLELQISKMTEGKEGEEIDEEEKKARAQSMDMMKKMAGAFMQSMEAKVTPTGETRKINNWNCRKYIVETSMGMMGKSTSETWASEEVKADPKLYWMAANATMLQQPGFEKILKEMEKIKGFVIMQTTTSEAMGAKITMKDEVEELTEKAAPAGTYEIPAGYKEQK